MRLWELAGTATIPYPAEFNGIPQEPWRWSEMETELVSGIDHAGIAGPSILGADGPAWQWVLLPWNAVDFLHADTNGSAGFDGRVPALVDWLETADALERLAMDEAEVLVASLPGHAAAVGYDGEPLEAQFRRVNPTRMLSVYPLLATVDHVGENPWAPHFGMAS